jgi:hypothetical protein
MGPSPSRTASRNLEKTSGQRDGISQELVQETDVSRSPKGRTIALAQAGCILLGWVRANGTHNSEYQLDWILSFDQRALASRDGSYYDAAKK